MERREGEAHMQFLAPPHTLDIVDTTSGYVFV